MKYLNDISYKDCVGKVCKSTSSGDFKILKYNDNRNVEVQFLKTGYEATVELVQVKRGNVKDPYLPSVCGVGVIGDKYQVSEGGKNTKEYVLWCSMLKRCYSNAYNKRQPTYEGCEASENFKYYEYFYEWCNKQVGFNNKDWQLDKDLLTKGNKVYSENTCIFIPAEINLLLVKREALRGTHPIGVRWHKRDKAFVARVCKNKGVSEWLGYFNTEIEAFNAYKKAKESFIKEQAEKWKDKIDERAYEALMAYTVEITD